MLDESLPQGRSLRSEETSILAALLKPPLDQYVCGLATCKVQDLDDGGMGGIKFLRESGKPRSFGKTIAEAEYIDADGVLVSIAINVDDVGDLLEIEFWKVNYAALCIYPKPEQLSIR